MAIDKQKQMPWTVSQIENEKPPVPTTKAMLSGYIANSMNGGHNRTIFWKKVMAGEFHRETRIKMNIKMLTPKTPTYQNLKMTLRTYFVPNSRVWNNAEKFTAQKGGTSEVKIEEYPNSRGLVMPAYKTEEGVINLCNMERWRNAFISSYYPRVGLLINEETADIGLNMPALNILPLRGRIAIYNDYERNREYDEEIQEYKSDNVSNAEWFSYMPDEQSGKYMDILNMRAKRENNYYTDYRTEYQGFESSDPISEGNLDQGAELVEWASWESKIAEARSQAENAQMQDREVIAKIRGSKLLTEGKVQLIGKKTFNLNYATVTQSTYNTASGIEENFQIMGQQGAYSYTEVNVPIYAGMEFNEEGFIHVIATVSADSVFESGIERTLLNVQALDEYRPDLKDDKLDVLYQCEMGTDLENASLINNWRTPQGFKRKYSELLKLPNVIAGDMTSDNYYKDTAAGEVDYDFKGNYEQIITQKTFQFFEKSAAFQENTGYNKKIWKDYTDLLINKNQAIMNTTTKFMNANQEGNNGGIRVDGQNQIFFVGKVECMAELPIDPNIAGNYTKWGEH